MIHTEFGHSITFISQNWNSNPEFVAPLDKVGEIYVDPSIPIYAQRHIDKNTWESWHLIPESRPTLSKPAQKTTVLDGGVAVNGDIDLSLSVIPYPIFSPREGSFTFIYNPLVLMVNNDTRTWKDIDSEMCNFFNGRKLRMVLEDDPTNYYEGEFKVESWESNNDGSGSTVTIGYKVFPYKMAIYDSLHDDNTVFDMYIRSGNDIQPKEKYSDLIGPNRGGDDGKTYDESPWYGTDYDIEEPKKELHLFGYVGTMPHIPLIHWCPDTANNKLIVNYVNFTYGIDYGKSGIRYKYLDPSEINNSSGVSLVRTYTDSQNLNWYVFKDSDMLFCDAYGGEYQFIQFIGNGWIKIETRKGSL